MSADPTAITPPVIQGAEAAQQALRDWQAVRGDHAIQYAPVPMPAPIPPKPPGWLAALAKFLRALLEPIGRALGLSWPVLQWVLIALAAAAALYIAWRLAEPLRTRARAGKAEPEGEWAPARAEAQALLADADALAAGGEYDAATHLLLRRSVAEIAAAQPGWVTLASTARELAALRALPQRARHAFTVIAIRVEASRFALQPLGEADWQAARAAYAEFALQALPAGGPQ